MSMLKTGGTGSEKEQPGRAVAPANADAATAPAIDVAKIEALRHITADARFVARLAGAFIANSRTALAGVETAISADDCASLHKLAHRLKSSSAYLGATRLSKLCADLERTALEGDARRCAVLAREVAREFELAEQEIRVYL